MRCLSGVEEESKVKIENNNMERDEMSDLVIRSDED